MKTREQLIEFVVDYRSDSDLDLIMEILQTPTEEHMKCPFCLVMNLEDYHQHLEEDTIDDSTYIEKVKYCEVCGRKLED